MPTPTLGHIRNNDENPEDYLARVKKFTDGEYKGKPGISLGVAIQLLRTPAASEGTGGRQGEAIVKARGHQITISDQIKDLIYLPTPLVDDSKNSGHNQNRISTLASEVFLLPTPTTMESREIKTAEQIENLKKLYSGGYRNLREVIINETPNRETWGKFTAAIERWEQILGRPAPAPTKPDGKDGSHRLSSNFTEWIMGLPEGWITSVGLTRVQELKALGNGVVPGQAKAAIAIMLNRIQ